MWGIVLTDCVNYCSTEFKQTWFSKAATPKGFTKYVFSFPKIQMKTCTEVSFQ